MNKFKFWSLIWSMSFVNPSHVHDSRLDYEMHCDKVNEVSVDKNGYIRAVYAIYKTDSAKGIIRYVHTTVYREVKVDQEKYRKLMQNH